MTNEEFVGFACPHSWFLVADDLHGQALKLRDGYGHGFLRRKDHQTGREAFWDNTDRATFLLASFALENAIKAFLVFENPSWISNGTLAKPLRNHKLTELAALSKHAPYRRKARKILGTFEDGNESWARYPCALNKASSTDPANLSPEIWTDYEWLISAYGRRLTKLLSQHWKGPHGFEATYEIHGTFLDALN